MRAFVAVEVPPPNAAPSARAAPEHLTLLFLGEVPADDVGRIVAALGPVGSALPPFDVTIDGVGAFPSRERPRVVWVGATEGAEALTALAHRVREALSMPPDEGRREAFVPHLTLLRVRSPADRRYADALLSGTASRPAPRRFRVTEFVLKESVLSSRGATHTVVAAFPLSGPAAPGRSG